MRAPPKSHISLVGWERSSLKLVRTASAWGRSVATMRWRSFGTHTAMSAATTNATTSPHVVTLAATGYTVVDQVVPGALTFPDTAVGASSPTQTVITITNPNARGIVAVAYPQLSNGTDFGFTYGANGDFCGYTRTALNPGESCNIYVYARPQSSGARSTTVTVTTNATTSPRSVTLTVTASGGSEELRNANLVSADVRPPDAGCETPSTRNGLFIGRIHP